MTKGRPLRDNHFKLGAKVQLSQLGRERCPDMPRHAGVVVGLSRLFTAARVQFPARKTSISLHISYLELMDIDR